MNRRVSLKMFSIISLVIAPFIGGWGIYQLMQLPGLADDADINTDIMPFGILGAFELLRAGMSSFVFIMALIIGGFCVFNALWMTVFGILSLIAVKKQSVRFIKGLQWAVRILMALVFAFVLIPSIPALAKSFIVFACCFIGCGLMTLSLNMFNKVIGSELDNMTAPPAEEQDLPSQI